jgi:uncharacterized protein (DUF488 family)
VTILTIGHSTHSFEKFAALLHAHGVRQIADVRTLAKSRRMPHFSGDALGAALRARAVHYRHFPALGGLRRPRSDSINTAWRNQSFRGYADHMQTREFADAVADFIAWSRVDTTAAMCAEAVWWRCHRSLLADALLVRAVAVRHILSDARTETHKLRDFARTSGERITYPGLV